ncbi:putative ABC transporter [Actinacidiphila reveromycinica]|uniref:Putative ABC transporter n=1 Tax=Actinacidiphila reveromycinica TaxID=659352 RepID=A0A7U3UQV6_9ACTN|nr:ABC transporter substrate-binding protein [Streptomyces sp. SN-593]BBA97043.1 putative ABC transporter [Streptomyces sp. SN-593]
MRTVRRGGEVPRVRGRSVLGRRAGSAALAVALATAAAACGGSGGAAAPTAEGGSVAAAHNAVRPWSRLTPLADPRAYQGPTTAKVSDADISPVTTTPHPVLPAEVVDHQGTKVTVRSTDRILALDLYGTLSATVYGLGLGPHLVGRDQSTGFPEAAKLPVVTGSTHQLNAEAILKLHPTVLVTDTTLGPWDVVLQMRSAGIPVVVVSAERGIGTVGSLVGEVAAALGVEPEGRLLAQRLDRQIAAERAQIAKVVPADPSRRPRIVFLYARGQAGVYYVFGKGSGADSLIDAVGGVDVATEAGIKGFSPLNAEALAKAEPDVILMMTLGLKSVGGVDGALRLPGVAETEAGKHRRIVDMSDYQVLSFGPLTAPVLDGLARALYAPGQDDAAKTATGAASATPTPTATATASAPAPATATGGAR